MKAFGIFAGLAIVALAFSSANAEDKKRNPFDLPDIEDVDSDEVKEYGKGIELKGDKEDPNAKEWVTEKSEGKKGSIDGEWHGRWNSYNDADAWINGTEAATVKTVGDRVYIKFKYGDNTYLVDTKREKNRLVGKYRNTQNADDAGMIALVIVDDERIDGDWRKTGRWDFQRRLK